MANALERLGRWQEALDKLNRYRAYAPADERPVLERRMRNIERRLDEQRARDQDRASKEEAAAAERGRVAEEEREARRQEERTAAAPAPAPAPAAPPARVAGAVLLGTGAAAAAVGAGLSARGLEAREAARANCKEVDTGYLCAASAASDLDDDITFARAGDIAMIAGGVTAATGLILLIVDATGTTPKTASSLRLLPTGGPTGAAVVLTGRFGGPRGASR